MKKILTLGEIMLRLSTIEDSRLEESTRLAAHYGGGEANVAISLANFGHQALFASKIPENAIGKGAKHHLMKYGVETSHLLMGGERLGTYYLENGTGIRSTSVIYDRCHSSFSKMDELEWDLDQLFENVHLFHISGITPALSLKWQDWVLLLIKEAKKRQIIVSLDINYRGKLWSVNECRSFLQRIVQYVDWCSAARLDALNFFEIPEKEDADLNYYYHEIIQRYPSIKVLYSTSREVITPQHHRLQGNLLIEESLFQSKVIDIQNIVDRVGGGDAFAAGILHGLLTKMTPQKTIDFATTASALKHSIHGDCNQFSSEKVEQVLNERNGDVKR